MVGHVAVTAIDPTRAASHSKRVINDLLRKQWGYQGIIITDDLVMGPIYEHGVCAAVTEALNAGVDLLLVAYDGLQFYRMYHCALSASADGRLDDAMLKSSLARLNLKRPDIADRAAAASDFRTLIPAVILLSSCGLALTTRPFCRRVCRRPCPSLRAC